MSATQHEIDRRRRQEILDHTLQACVREQLTIALNDPAFQALLDDYAADPAASAAILLEIKAYLLTRTTIGR